MVVSKSLCDYGKEGVDFHELEQMPTADLYTLLDDIPSDNESYDTECDTETDEDDIDSDLEFSQENPIEMLVTLHNNIEPEWNSEDELPLSALLLPRTGANFVDQSVFIGRNP
nr:unnamed protein product [Callosobruchus analis]